MQTLLERYARVEDQVACACRKAGRLRSEVLLLAVSKFQPAEAVAEVAAAGQRAFGENYVQEAFAKREALESDCLELRWHLIGHVQHRKAAQVAGAFTLIHTLDSVRLAHALEKSLVEKNRMQAVLIEVNIAAEPQKAGVMPQALAELATCALEKCPHLQLQGLMCLPPVFDSGEAARPYFEKLRELRDKLARETGASLPELSMGMSGDFGVAIEEGATIVRVGTSIFGPRPVRAV